MNATLEPLDGWEQLLAATLLGTRGVRERGYLRPNFLPQFEKPLHTCNRRRRCDRAGYVDDESAALSAGGALSPNLRCHLRVGAVLQATNWVDVREHRHAVTNGCHGLLDVVDVYPRRLGTHRSPGATSAPSGRIPSVLRLLHACRGSSANFHFGVFPTFAGIALHGGLRNEPVGACGGELLEAVGDAAVVEQERLVAHSVDLVDQRRRVGEGESLVVTKRDDLAGDQGVVQEEGVAAGRAPRRTCTV